MRTCACCKESTDEQFLLEYTRNNVQNHHVTLEKINVCEYCDIDYCEAVEDNYGNLSGWKITANGKTYKRGVN